MPKQELDRAVRLYKSIRQKEYETALVSNDLREAIVKLSNQEFAEYMKLTISDKITVENEVEECKKNM